MKSRGLSEIYKLIPPCAKNEVYIFTKGENIETFQNLIIKDMRDPDKKIERAIILFERGISQKKVKEVAFNIVKALDKENISKDAPENVHLMVRSGVTRKEIRKTIKYFEESTDTLIRTY